MAETSIGQQRVKHWQRPSYLDSWGRPPFENERYLFSESLVQKHHDALEWAGMQIGFLMEAALNEFESLGISKQEAAEKLKKRLREERRKEAEEFIRQNDVPLEARDARYIGHLIMRWEAALGVSGEVMINTPTRFLRRFYGGDPWDRHLTGLILDIMGAEGEGLSQGINPNLIFRTNRYSCAGDEFDEWVVEPVDEESVGRTPRIPD
jgi:hypothetical protein